MTKEVSWVSYYWSLSTFCYSLLVLIPVQSLKIYAPPSRFGAPQNLPRVDPELYPRVDYIDSQNLPLPPRIYPPFQQLYATLPESTPPSQNLVPFSTTIILCDPFRIYPSLPEYNPLFSNYNIMRHSQYLTLVPRIYPSFQQMHMCDPPRIYPSLPEYTPLFNNYMWPSQNLPLPPRIYPSFQQQYVTLPESTPPSQNIPLFSTTICDHPRIYPSLPESSPLFNDYNIMRPFQNLPLPPRI